MRVFASDTIKNLMGKFGIPEDEAIENSMVSRALESAQTKIEGFNFDARKHVLEYDNVLDKQRRAIYTNRNKVLVGSSEDVWSVLEEFAGTLSNPALPIEGDSLQDILEKKAEEVGKENLITVARTIVLQTLDNLWVEHLESMEYLRGSVNLRAYGQRDPLVEYRKEGTRLYKDMELQLASRVFELIEKLTKESAANATSLSAPAASVAPAIKLQMPGPAIESKEINRNDPCPCGSGKKWKNCGLKNTEEHQRLMAAKK